MANILLLESDLVLVETYARALRQAGHDVCQVTDAQTAIQSADACRPDLVILEFQLAAHNGIEFLYEFRSYAEWQAVPVIIQSVVPPTAVQILTLQRELGVNAYHYKPRTSLHQLLASVDEQLVMAV